MKYLQSIATVLSIASLFTSSFTHFMPDRDLHSPLFVVNKKYLLGKNYAPEITTIQAFGVEREIRSDLYDPLSDLIQGAKADGVDMHLVSGYRSYAKQAKVFDTKQSKVGKEKAADVVALPGSSEHQLGLSVDVSYDNWMGINERLENTKQGKWLRKQGYDYGFIVRYLREYEDVTGYTYEPWHIRYVGKEHAKAIYELGEIPLEYYTSQLRAKAFMQALEPKQASWNYPIALQSLLSVYNDELAQINQTLQGSSEHRPFTDEVWQALEQLQNMASEENLDLQFETVQSKTIKKAESPVLIHIDETAATKRFLQSKAHLAGFIAHDGNWRYIGPEIASYLFENKLGFEEFSIQWKTALAEYLQQGGTVLP
ncbi:MAG: M15 family metallopeptidase [Eubacteriales bacterium]|nr:M15 family metallopeptidase [Eubacteriales bacterium]